HLGGAFGLGHPVILLLIRIAMLTRSAIGSKLSATEFSRLSPADIVARGRRRRCTPTLRVSERQPFCSHPHDHKPHGHRQSPCRERPGRPHPPRRVPPPPPDPLRIAHASRGWF